MPGPLTIRDATVRAGVLEVTTESGTTGRGGPLRGAAPGLRGREITGLEPMRAALGDDYPAVEMACLDALGKARGAPVYQLLGGPTRYKVRVLTPLARGTPDEMMAAMERGARAFRVPAPGDAPARSFVSAVVARLEALRKAGGDGVDFVLAADGKLQPREALRVARAIEGLHVMWFDEPCAASNLAALRELASQTVTPLGFGSSLTTPGAFLDLLREQAAGVLRPRIARFGFAGVRRIAAVAETYYTGVAPIAESGALGRAAALHLAASLPNFVIQELEGGGLKDGFAAIENRPGLGLGEARA
jgi:galactonate dehydratase